ncbi:MAG: NAD(P)H-hydrate dehydratase [Actinomycetota bacterium]
MRPLFRPSEMQEADRLTIEAGTPGRVLMERAGRAVARMVVEEAGGRYGVRVLVVCGKGNNGGDGFVTARVLDAWGMGVTCITTFDASEARGDALHHLELLRRAGLKPWPWHPSIDTDRFDVVVDAVFGTGFSGVAEGVAAEAIHAISGHRCVIAVDIPSGVDGETGAVRGAAVRATATVALGAEKTGTALPPGSVLAGRVTVADIGIDTSVRKFERSGHGIVVGSFVEMTKVGDVAASLPERSPLAHKRTSGSVAVLAGSDAYPGAAVLTALGAMRAGAGYVTLGSTPTTIRTALSHAPELLTVAVADGEALGPDSVGAFAQVIDKAQVVAVGPGLGTGEGQRDLLERLLALDKPLVIDADGLNVLAEDPSPLAKRSVPAVITPHPAELGRLLGVSTEEVMGDRLGAALKASGRFPSSVVIAKGHRSVVAYRAGQVAVVIPVGGPELATAGTGDVLTGVVAALIAQQRPAVGAAIAAAYIHGVAGSVAGQRVGHGGVVATDVADAVPEAVSLIRAAPR